MAESDSDSGPAQVSNLLTSIQRMLSTLVEIVQTRVELASTELEEERARLQEIAVFGLVAAFFIGIGVVLATFFLIMAFWETHRLEVLGISAGIYLLAGIVTAFAVRNKLKNKPPAFSSTIAELQKDRDRLSPRS
jgi:uncharacterized membrane protein YqjE